MVVSCMPGGLIGMDWIHIPYMFSNILAGRVVVVGLLVTGQITIISLFRGRLCEFVD